MELFNHQKEALQAVRHLNKCAFYHDMGLGKTFTGAEKMDELGAQVNLVICQKSKVSDWVEHFKTHYPNYYTYDLTNKVDFSVFFKLISFTELPHNDLIYVGVINYELAFRRGSLATLKDFTLMLDESSLIQNEQAKRSKFILKKLNPKNVILLSGTPTGGKYEKLWSQLKLLGWEISKKTFYNTYIDYHYDTSGGFPLMVVDGYKNVERLKRKMREYGCHFLKGVIDLPKQNFIPVRVPVSKEYKKFRKDRVITVEGNKLVGDNTLTKMLYERQLCGVYSKDKLEAFKDLLESTEDRLIVFYNFTSELEKLVKIVSEIGRDVSLVNGTEKDLSAYNMDNSSVIFIQYQAGAMGLNLQKANKIIYFTPPLSSELYEQSKKRIHRIGQERPCYYYNLTVTGSVEERIYKTLTMRRDYTENLFEYEDKENV